MSSQGGRGQKLPILLSKKTTKRGGGGQKSPILRRHSLWTDPKWILEVINFREIKSIVTVVYVVFCQVNTGYSGINALFLFLRCNFI